MAGLVDPIDLFSQLLKLTVTCKQKPFTLDHVVILLLTFNNHSILVTQAYTQNNNKDTAKPAHTPNVNLSNQSTVSVFPCHQQTPTAGLTNKNNDHTVQITGRLRLTSQCLNPPNQHQCLSRSGAVGAAATQTQHRPTAHRVNAKPSRSKNSTRATV